jgi:hypothetical protein
MLLLTSTSDIVRVVTGSAANLEVHASWVDNASGTITPGRTNTAAITTATTTTVVGSPGASTQRNVKHLSIINSHASTSTTVSVQHFDASNSETLWSGVLLAGEGVDFTEKGEWIYFDVTGARKAPSTKLDVCLRVTANSVHATAATFAGITGLAQAVQSGKRYTVEAHLFHIANATTSGAFFAFGGVAMTTMVAGSMSVVTAGVATTTLSSGIVTAVDTAIIAQTTSSTAANVPTIVAGMFQPSADGTFLLKASSEVSVAAGLTVLAGSWMRIRECDN